MAQRTFSIIKPDAVRKGFTGAILAEIYKAGFQIVSIKRLSISKKQAEGFYYVHKERPFFDGLKIDIANGRIHRRTCQSFPDTCTKQNTDPQSRNCGAFGQSNRVRPPPRPMPPKRNSIFQGAMPSTP